MTRGRAPLTDKEEKILIQAQLMGLSTASMVKIGNRLRALEKDRRDKAEIDEYTQGFTWNKLMDPVQPHRQIGWSVTTPEGHVCEFTHRKRVTSRSWYQRTFNYRVKISKPGTRFKVREVKKAEINVHDDWRARLCPENNKELYAMVRWARNVKRYMEAVK